MNISSAKIAFIWLAAVALVSGQGSQLPKYTVATLPAASTLPTYSVQVIDGTTPTDCTIGGAVGTALHNVICVASWNGSSYAWAPITPGAGNIVGLSGDGTGNVTITKKLSAGSVAAPTIVPTNPYKYLYVGWAGGNASTFLTAGSDDGTNWTATGGAVTNDQSTYNYNAPLAVWYNNQWILSEWNNGVPWSLYSSQDGKNFTFLTTPTAWTSAQLGYTPQLCYATTEFIDVDNTLHLYAPCSPNNDGTGFQVYETHPLNSALTSWSGPVLVSTPGGANVYDLSVYYLNGQYWGLYYNHATGQSDFAVATNALGPFLAVPGDTASGLMYLGEGPQLFRIGNHIRAYGDGVGTALDYRDCYDSYPAALPSSKVVAEYDFVQGSSSTTLYDKSGNGFNGTLSTAAPSWVSGGGLTFNGTSNYVDLGNPLALNITHNLWVVAAFTVGSSTTGTILGKNDGATNAGSAYQMTAGSTPGPYYPTFNVFSGANVYAPGQIATANGSWVIFTGYLNSTTGQVTGIESTMQSASATATTSALNTVSAHAVIGANGSMSNGFFSGTIGYLVILNQAPASEYERLQAYNYVQQKIAARGVNTDAFDLPVGNTYNLATCGWTQVTPWAYGSASTWPWAAKHGSITLNPMWIEANYNALSNPPVSAPAGASLSILNPAFTGTMTGPSYTDGYVTYSLAQINRPNANIEMQVGAQTGSGVRYGGNSSSPTLIHADSGNIDVGNHLNSGGGFAGWCIMSSGTTCTWNLRTAYNYPFCVAQAQGSTPMAASCSVSGTTVTVTAATANSLTWSSIVIGIPN